MLFVIIRGIDMYYCTYAHARESIVDRNGNIWGAVAAVHRSGN